MREFDYENPFNSENLWMDYDPMYAMTADYIDQFGTVEYQQTADLESYVDALWLATYQRILINGIKKGTVPHPTGAAVTDCFLQRLEPSIKEDAAPGIFNLDAIFLVKTSDRFQQQYRVCGCIDLVGNYETIPYSSDAITVIVDKIDVQTLDQLSSDELCSRSGATIASLQTEKTVYNEKDEKLLPGGQNSASSVLMEIGQLIDR